MRHQCIIVALILNSECFSSSDEVARVRSPKGLTVAVLMESNGGATVSFGYEVFLTRAGGSSIWGTDVAGLFADSRAPSGGMLSNQQRLHH